MDIYNQIKNSEVTVAVIYSKHEVDSYTVHLYQNGQDLPLSDTSGHVIKFDSLESAKNRLRKQKVKQAYLALDNVYDEFDELSFENHKKNIESRYDYMPIEL